MIDLLIVLAVELAALPWMIVRAAAWLDGMEHMDSRAWINHLADKSRKKKNGKRRYARWIGMGF